MPSAHKEPRFKVRLAQAGYCPVDREHYYLATEDGIRIYVHGACYCAAPTPALVVNLLRKTHGQYCTFCRLPIDLETIQKVIPRCCVPTLKVCQ